MIDEQDAWDYIVARYAEPREAERLLALQEATGLDIVLHLFCEYAERRLNRPLDPAQHAQAQREVARWRAEVILPLRAIRKATKQARYGAGFDERLPDLRTRMSAIEIDAERAQLEALCIWFGRANEGG